MRKKLTSFLFLYLFSILSIPTAFALDEAVILSIQNLNISYDGYNKSNYSITGINFSIGAELKSSSENTSVPFKVILMLVPKGATSTTEGIVAWSEEVAGGKLHQGGTWDYNNKTIYLSPNIPEGTYRLYAYVEGYSEKGAWFNADDYFYYTRNIAQPVLPDLTVGSVNYSFNKETGIINDVVIEVENQLNTQAAASVISLRFEASLDGMIIEDSITDLIDVISANSTLKYVAGPINLHDVFGGYNAAAIIKLTVTVDVEKKVKEVVENNNVKVIPDISTITSTVGSVLFNNISIPNPLTAEVLSSLLLKDNNIKTINLYSIEGKRIEISTAITGLYILEIETVSGSFKKKVILNN